jgi:quinol monooxygenase YgiN
MPVTVLLELKFKPESVAAAREVMGSALKDTRAFDGNLVTDVIVDEDDAAHWIIYERWESVEQDEAYRSFRAGEGKIVELPPLLAAPPVKTRYVDTDV